jgi:2-polyprenyl-3-methyl-5-hydroxy-6-metoxy-1,4-benzoquinol methylase
MNKRSPSVKPADYSFSFNKFVYNLVPENTTVLDIGCWNGNLGKALISGKGCVVDGVDFSKEILKEALNNGYKKTYLMDLNKDPEKIKSLQNKYDVIVCADILEHLIDPKSVLSSLGKKLKPNGIIVISLPNVAFLLNRINLMLGKWDYTEFGILDKTHVRFFTKKTLKELVIDADLEVVDEKPYNQFGLLTKIYPLDRFFPSLLCFQLGVIAKKKNAK